MTTQTLHSLLSIIEVEMAAIPAEQTTMRGAYANLAEATRYLLLLQFDWRASPPGGGEIPERGKRITLV